MTGASMEDQIRHAGLARLANEHGERIYGAEWGNVRPELVSQFTSGRTFRMAGLDMNEMERIVGFIKLSKEQTVELDSLLVLGTATSCWPL